MRRIYFEVFGSCEKQNKDHIRSKPDGTEDPNSKRMAVPNPGFKNKTGDQQESYNNGEDEDES
jgi:hypothetical protein